jgi:hypothetical protein
MWTLPPAMKGTEWIRIRAQPWINRPVTMTLGNGWTATNYGFVSAVRRLGGFTLRQRRAIWRALTRPIKRLMPYAMEAD